VGGRTRAGTAGHRRQLAGFGVAAAGRLLIFIGLFLPLFTVHYSPPGGSAIVDGQRIGAFTESISGWQFATTALWTNLLYVLGIFFLPIAGVILAAMDLEGAKFAVKPVVALFRIVVGVGWLLLLGLGLIEDSLVMTGPSALSCGHRLTTALPATSVVSQGR
jgi:hypothetical protein